MPMPDPADDTSPIETVPIADIYADGIGNVEIIGSNYRITYFAWQAPPGLADGTPERVVAARIVCPLASYAPGRLGVWLERAKQRSQNRARSSGH